MSINLPIHNFKILALRPVINRLKLMKTETGLKTAKNRGLHFFCGLVRSFDCWGKCRAVTITVKALWHQKTGPDRTFKHYFWWGPGGVQMESRWIYGVHVESRWILNKIMGWSLFWLVFGSLVLWLEKDRTQTAKDWTCGPVFLFLRCKDRKKTG